MDTYLLIAPRLLGMIPKGYMLQVATRSSGGPRVEEIEAAIIRAGFTDTHSRSFRSAGNWIVKKLS